MPFPPAPPQIIATTSTRLRLPDRAKRSSAAARALAHHEILCRITGLAQRKTHTNDRRSTLRRTTEPQGAHHPRYGSTANSQAYPSPDPPTCRTRSARGIPRPVEGTTPALRRNTACNLLRHTAVGQHVSYLLAPRIFIRLLV